CIGVCVFFFFQAEDGIRDFHVTGVQTCALPIWSDSSGTDLDCPGTGRTAWEPKRELMSPAGVSEGLPLARVIAEVSPIFFMPVEDRRDGGSGGRDGARMADAGVGGSLARRSSHSRIARRWLSIADPTISLT